MRVMLAWLVSVSVDDNRRMLLFGLFEKAASTSADVSSSVDVRGRPLGLASTLSVFLEFVNQFRVMSDLNSVGVSCIELFRH